MTLHKYLSTHLLTADKHLTLTLDQGSTHVKCALFLNDSCSSPQKTPKASNLRKILWVIQQKMIVQTLKNVAWRCLQHARHRLGYSNYIMYSLKLPQP